MKYFNSDFIKFFKGLRKNNSSEWFNDNRKIYEKEVKKPFNELVQDMITLISKDDKEINVKPSECIFRINRDIRFSKDKTPYKLHVSANISARGKKSTGFPGFYFHFADDSTWIGGGCYELEKDQLNKIRQEISYNLDEFSAILKGKEFKKRYETIQGEKNKVMPAEFKEDVKLQPLIANKQFYYMAELDAKLALSDSLEEELFKYYLTGKPVNLFLKKALQ